MKFGKIITILALLGSINTFALTKEETTLPDTETVSNHPLLLNGIGFRKATFLKIKVYAAGLYLEKKSQISDDIINSPGVKKVVMKFQRNVSAGDAKGAWEKSFKNLCDSQCDSMQADFQKLLVAMEDLKEGDFMAYTFEPDHLTLTIRGEKKLELANGSLAKLLLKTWIGPNPPNSELKEGLLGL